MDAGPPEFDHRRPEVVKAAQVEFGFRVQPSEPTGLDGGQHSVGPHHAERCFVPDDQVVAVRVELVCVESVLASQFRSKFLGEDLEPQPLRILDGGGVAGNRD